GRTELVRGDGPTDVVEPLARLVPSDWFGEDRPSRVLAAGGVEVVGERLVARRDAEGVREELTTRGPVWRNERCRSSSVRSPTTARKYSRPRSTESSRPSRARIWLPGSQTAPPEYADVPPKRSVFSTTQVVSPREVAAAAPNRAATPEPTTITS